MRWARRHWLDIVSILVAAVVFLVPFVFIVLTAVKDQASAAELDFTWPTSWHVGDNLRDVFSARNSALVTALKNSLILTVVSVTLVVVLSAMVGFVIQRRQDRLAKAAELLVFLGLVVPPAIVPTVFVLQKLDLFKTLQGLVLVEVAISLPFGVILFKAFMSNIPRELDEAAMLDGCNSFSLFFRVIFPLLRPVIITMIVVTSVAVYNDFVNPLYFLPGDDNVTVQLTLFNFQSQFNNQWNLLFMDVLIITIPPLIMFIFFNRKIVEGMTAGAVKG